MTLVSNGSITEGGADAPADIIAAALVLSAATGIGTPGNAIETQTTFIEAETNTGGINIANSGQVQIGGITADVDGLDVATSGDINFSTIGFIFLADTSGPEMVHGGDMSGNVTLTAIGADADIYATIDQVTGEGRRAAASPSMRAAMSSPGSAGPTSTTTSSPRPSSTSMPAATSCSTARRTSAPAPSAGSSAVPSTSRPGATSPCPIRPAACRRSRRSRATSRSRPARAAPINQNATFSAAVQTTHDIILNADTVLINSGGLNTTGIGSITIRPVTPGRAIDIGSTIDPCGALSLSDAELDRLFTLNVNIGDANSGPVDFSAPVSPFLYRTIWSCAAPPRSWSARRSPSLCEGSLTLRAGDDLFFTPAGSFTTTSGGFTGFVDEAQDDGGAGGVGDLRQAVFNATSITLIGNIDGDTLFGSNGNDALNGRGGADTMDGGAGNDHFTVDNAGDVIVEAAGQGTNDRARSSVTYALGAGVEVELLSTFGIATTAVINLTGNEFANILEGNAANNFLNGAGGVDSLKGFAGNDCLYRGQRIGRGHRSRGPGHRQRERIGELRARGGCRSRDTANDERRRHDRDQPDRQ